MEKNSANNHDAHPLEEWLDKNEKTVAEFQRMLKASGVRVTRYAIDLWLVEESTPNLRNAYAIQKATGGDVTMEMLAEFSNF